MWPTLLSSPFSFTATRHNTTWAKIKIFELDRLIFHLLWPNSTASLGPVQRVVEFPKGACASHLRATPYFIIWETFTTDREETLLSGDSTMKGTGRTNYFCLTMVRGTSNCNS